MATPSECYRSRPCMLLPPRQMRRCLLSARHPIILSKLTRSADLSHQILKACGGRVPDLFVKSNLMTGFQDDGAGEKA
eukprot:763940-Hanusia_phi.AAC.12